MRSDDWQRLGVDGNAVSSLPRLFAGCICGILATVVFDASLPPRRRVVDPGAHDLESLAQLLPAPARRYHHRISHLRHEALKETSLSASRLENKRTLDSAWLLGTLAFLALAVIGLLIVKWFPYWHKAHVAAATHAIGASIVSGKGVAPPAAGLAAAWQYTVAYFNSVWM